MSNHVPMQSNCNAVGFRKQMLGAMRLILVLFLVIVSGNLMAQTITVDGNPSDWSASNLSLFLTKKYQSDPFGNGVVDNQFTEGSKDFFPANQLVWSISQTKAKNDIANGAAILKDGILYFAGDRTSNNGDAQIGFWLYLNGTGPVTGAGGNIFAPPHVDGDVLVLADFTGGGRNALVSIYQWDAAGNGNVPNTNGNLRTTNLTGTVAENNNAEYPIPQGWSFVKNVYQYNMFYEGRVDLTQLSLPSLCKASFLLETRSSQSVTASLDDFVAGIFNATPSPLVLTGSTYCAGVSGAGTITSATSEAGFSYQLYNGSGLAVGSLKTGTGSALSWTNIPAGNGYYVVGTGQLNCNSTSNSVNVIESSVSLNAIGNNPSCFGDNASITFSATSSNGGVITYTVNGVAASSPYTVTVSGIYTIAARNSDGCTDTKQITITIPSKVVLLAGGTNPDCFDKPGIITFSASGGTGLISYTVNGVAATSPYPAGTGTYTILAKDINGCTDSKQISIIVPSKVNLTASGTNPDCFNQLGSITFSATGGTGTKSYTVNGVAATSPFAAGTGNYTIVATDANGCTDIKQVAITVPSKVDLTASGTNPDCFGQLGTITFSATGGTGTKTFTVNGVTATSPFSAGEGTYLVVAKDANGCTDSKQIKIAVPSKVDLTATGTNPDCFGQLGSITFSASGGTGPKSFTVNGVAASSPYSAGNGTYTIVAKDANGCMDSKQVTIAVPSKVELTAVGTNPPCFGLLGSITFSATGGTGTKTFTVNGVTASSPFNAGSGTYNIVARDVNGCTDAKSVTITVPSDLIVNAENTSVCVGNKKQLSATPAGGVWSGANVSASGEFDASLLAAGSYTVTYTYTNDKGCKKSDEAIVTVNSNPDCLITGGNPSNAPYCVGNGLPAPLGVFSGPAGMSSYKWSAQGSIAIVGVNNAQTVSIQVNGTGILSLEITNASGCKSACQKLILTIQGAPCSLEGLSKVCGGTENIYSDAAPFDPLVTYQWSITFVNGNPVPADVASFVGATNGSSVTVKAGMSAGTYVVRLTKLSPGACPTSCLVETTNIICSKALCSYTQGYFGNPGGIACTPTGPKTTTQLITESVSNMPGGVLYLGKPGRSFTAMIASDIIRILPGGGTPGQLPPGNHTPNSNQLLKRGRINNVLLSQTITLALNTYMLGSNLGNFSLTDAGGSKDKFLVTVAKQSGDCSALGNAEPAACRYAPVYCSDGVTISSYRTTYNPYKSWKLSAALINALPGDQTVMDLLMLASEVLGGAPLPAGVSYSHLSDAVAAINEGFDECRLFAGFASTGDVNIYCVAPVGTLCPAPVITSSRVNNGNNRPVLMEGMDASISIFPNPFREKLNFRFVSPVSGKATLELFNMHGQRLALVFDGNVTAGVPQTVEFKAQTPVSGMLIYKLSAGGKVLIGKVQSLK